MIKIVKKEGIKWLQIIILYKKKLKYLLKYYRVKKKIYPRLTLKKVNVI
jgi:hypothetical protein